MVAEDMGEDSQDSLGEDSLQEGTQVKEVDILVVVVVEENNCLFCHSYCETLQSIKFQSISSPNRLTTS